MQKILIVLILLVLFAQKAQAQMIEFHQPLPTATTNSIVYHDDAKDIKRETIKRLLEAHNSPMVGSVDTFIRVAEENNLNPYLLPSIAGVESTFGKAIYPGSYNPFGWGGGMIMFDSWDEAIETVGRGLRNNYVDRGALSLDEVGAIYAASKTWPTKVKYFITRFEQEELNSDFSAQKQLYFSLNGVE